MQLFDTPSRAWLLARVSLLAVWLTPWLQPSAWSQEEFVVELRNGMRLGPGIVTETDSLSTNSFQQGGGQSEGGSIGVMDDGLRRTYFNQSPRNLLQANPWVGPRTEQIELPSAAMTSSGNRTFSFLTIGISNFNKFGYRTQSLQTSRGQVDILQGITLLTPTYAKVEVLRTRETPKFMWDQRVAVSSIPADQLDAILRQALDMKKSGDWLRMVSYYIQAERYAQARQTMEEALRRFPTELADRVALLGLTEQQLAQQIFDEIKLRRDAGQPKMAAQLLSSFPAQSLPVETQVKLSEDLDALKQQLTEVADVADALQTTVAQLPDADQQIINPVIRELIDEMTLDTSARMADFQRLRGGADANAENLAALAIGGWLLGPGSGVQNFAVAKSLIRVRVKAREYLLEPSAPRREQILQELKSEEGAQPQLLAKLLATMKPIKPLPVTDDNDPVGLCRFQAELRDGSSVQYVVQLPPEYDPNRKYPCVLALPGSGEMPEVELDFWCGLHLPGQEGGMRMGHAARRGYIVIAPSWSPNGKPYEYTEGEHDRVLTCFRDALRHVSVDTDRVFISGHFDGANVAWDLAQSHPDLWAGGIFISPLPDKYIVHYHPNIRSSDSSPDEIPLGTYIVYGPYGSPDSMLGTTVTRFLKSPSFDTLVVEYLGRSRERFLAELPRIMQWMEMPSHRRMRVRRNIEAVTMRPGDRYFYWLEVPQVLANAAGNPFQMDPASSAKFEAAILDATLNTLRIMNIPSRNATLWLTPEMVDFSQPITVMLPRGDRKRFELQPDIAVMLEDARTRADLMHVFWQSISVP